VLQLSSWWRRRTVCICLGAASSFRCHELIGTRSSCSHSAFSVAASPARLRGAHCRDICVILSTPPPALVLDVFSRHFSFQITSVHNAWKFSAITCHKKCSLTYYISAYLLTCLLTYKILVLSSLSNASERHPNIETDVQLCC